jgi:peptidoglycan hydrolase CwlO-like protein
MMKKTLIGTAIAAALAVFVFGKDVVSYARTSASSVRDAVKSEVPLEFEIERAREIVKNLVPDIRDSMHVIAEQQVDIEDLSATIARNEGELSRQKGQILVLREDLAGGGEKFEYASVTYSSNDVKRDLAKRFELFKAAEESLLRDQQILAARRTSLDANQTKLDEMLASRQNFEVQLEQLGARLKTVQAAETVSDLEIDDSQLARAKTLIRELNKQLDVREKMLKVQSKFSGLIPVDASPVVPSNIGEQIDNYFDEGTRSEADVARLAG